MTDSHLARAMPLFCCCSKPAHAAQEYRPQDDHEPEAPSPQAEAGPAKARHLGPISAALPVGPAGALHCLHIWLSVFFSMLQGWVGCNAAATGSSLLVIIWGYAY